jgi:hypothetical protein
MNESEILALVNACRALPELPAAQLPVEYSYPCVPLCILDAVFSISARYGAVKNVIRRYCDHFALRPEALEQHTVQHFLRRVERLGPDGLATAVQNRQRTSTTNGILKAEAAIQFARVLRAHRIEVLPDVPRVFERADFARDVRAIPGQHSGISLAYFFMLAGSDEHIKPDRMVLRFVARAIGRELLPDEAVALVRAAAVRLRSQYPTLTPRLLDHVIWKDERRGLTAPRPTECPRPRRRRTVAA